MKPGRLIVFEGIDGGGKSTQLALLAAALEEAGERVVRTREPHDCEAGRRIREMARSGRPVAPEQELSWFREQRRAHVRDVIDPGLAAGQLVLCDRYFLSTVAYQGARGLDWPGLLQQSEAEFPLPDLVLLLEVEAEAGLARVRARGGAAEPVFEERAFLEQVASIFSRIERDYLLRVDGREDPERVAGAVARAVRERLGLLR